MKEDQVVWFRLAHQWIRLLVCSVVDDKILVKPLIPGDAPWRHAYVTADQIQVEEPSWSQLALDQDNDTEDLEYA